jgi:DNA-binding CsgD family transcriptional regulator
MYKRELKNLVRFLESKPDFADLAIYLGTNACLSGELSKVYIGKIEEDAQISSVATFGYKSDELEPISNFDLDSQKPICTVARKNVIVSRNNDESFYIEFPDAVKFSDPWKSIVCIPFGPRYVATLALQVPLENDENHDDYYETISLIIKMYVSIQITSKGKDTNSIHSSELLGKPLTKRQELIYSYMQKGMVNREIAETISYSESLVRQETIIIFSKLGIVGRKEIMSPE